jgi:hypothetical protein
VLGSKRSFRGLQHDLLQLQSEGDCEPVRSSITNTLLDVEFAAELELPVAGASASDLSLDLNNARPISRATKTVMMNVVGFINKLSLLANAARIGTSVGEVDDHTNRHPDD